MSEVCNVCYRPKASASTPLNLACLRWLGDWQDNERVLAECYRLGHERATAKHDALATEHAKWRQELQRVCSLAIPEGFGSGIPTAWLGMGDPLVNFPLVIGAMAAELAEWRAKAARAPIDLAALRAHESDLVLAYDTGAEAARQELAARKRGQTVSRNLCNTSCSCGLPLDDREREPSELLTDAEYAAVSAAKAHYGDNLGHGWQRDGRETRFRRIECPLCRRVYAGWYTQQFADPGLWRLFDASFFEAFDDEPDEGDGLYPGEGLSALERVRRLVAVVEAARAHDAEIRHGPGEELYQAAWGCRDALDALDAMTGTET